jgi:hypothetical protein
MHGAVVAKLCILRLSKGLVLAHRGCVVAQEKAGVLSGPSWPIIRRINTFQFNNAES